MKLAAAVNNIGSVFRTADAFLVEKIYLCGYTATPPNKDIQKTALGATKSVNWEYAENIILLIQSLKENYYQFQTIERTFLRLVLVLDQDLQMWKN